MRQSSVRALFTHLHGRTYALPIAQPSSSNLHYMYNVLQNRKSFPLWHSTQHTAYNPLESKRFDRHMWTCFANLRKCDTSVLVTYSAVSIRFRSFPWCLAEGCSQLAMLRLESAKYCNNEVKAHTAHSTQTHTAHSTQAEKQKISQHYGKFQFVRSISEF